MNCAVCVLCPLLGDNTPGHEILPGRLGVWAGPWGHGSVFSSFCFMHVPDFYNKLVLLLKQIISIKKFKTSRGKRDGPVEGSSGRITVRGNGFGPSQTEDSPALRWGHQPGQLNGGGASATGDEAQALQQSKDSWPPAGAPEARPGVAPVARVSGWAASTGRDRSQGHRRGEWGGTAGSLFSPQAQGWTRAGE